MTQTRPIYNFKQLLDAPTFKYVHALSTVTGNGTSGNPYIGWEAALNASVDGDFWQFVGGYFQNSVPVIIGGNGISLVGAGKGVTIIRSTYATANAATLAVKNPIAGGELRKLRIQGFTLDGNGVTPRGLSLWNVNWSAIRDIEFKNHTDWSFFGTRAIGNVYSGLFGGVNYGMTYATPNAMRISAIDPDSGDNATTTCTFDAVEFSGYTGTGLKIDDGGTFGNVFNGGAFEVCGVNLDMSSTNDFNNIFVGTDFEGTTGTGMKVRGLGHKFECCNCVGTPLSVTGQGGHTFSRCTLGAITDTGAIASIYEQGNADLTNWNVAAGTGVSVGYFDGGLITSRRGVNNHVAYSGNGHSVAWSSFVTGSRISHFVTCTDATYIVDETGGLTDAQLDTPATVAAAAAMKIVGLNVTFGGNVGTPILSMGGNVITDTTDGIYWHTAGGGNFYSIHREAGAWADPYPRLKLDWQTGIILDPGALSSKSYVEIAQSGLKLTNCNLILDTGAGTKIGTATSQKLAFFNSAPIVQPINTSDLRASIISLGLLASGGATPLDLNGGLMTAGDVSHAGNKLDKVVTLTDAATTTFDLSLGDMGVWTIGGARTFAVSNGHSGSFVVRITQDGTGSRIATWPASFKFSGGSTLSTTAGAVDLLSFVSVDGGTTYQATLTTGHA